MYRYVSLPYCSPGLVSVRVGALHLVEAAEYSVGLRGQERLLAAHVTEVAAHLIKTPQT